MIIPQGKVLVRAGKYQGGKLPYLSYVGQIKPADIGRILFWGPEGDDTTGDGTHATPYETFDKALEVFSTILHKWILRTDLGVYDEAGPYITDPADRVYLDTAGGNDANDGLTAGAAVQTYAAAKTALTGSGRSVIHVLGSVTLSDVIDAPTQGEIGETLEYAPSAQLLAPISIATLNSIGGILRLAAAGSTVIATSTNATVSFYRSTDYGKTFSNLGVTTTNFTGGAVATDGDGNWVIVGGSTSAAKTVFYSSDDGATWTRHGSIDAQFQSVCWSGQVFAAIGTNRTATTTAEVWTSPSGASWSSQTQAWGTATWTALRIASDGDGGIAASARIAATTPYYQTCGDHGVTWVDRSSLFTGLSVNQIRYSGGKWAALCNDGATTAARLYFSTAFTTTWTERTGVFTGTGSAGQNALDVLYSPRLDSWIIHKFAVSPTTRFLIAVTDSTITTLYTDTTNIIQNSGLAIVENSAESMIVFGDVVGSSRAVIFDLQTNVAADVTNIEAEYIAMAESISAANITVENTTLAMRTQDGCALKLSKVKTTSQSLVHNGAAVSMKRNILVGAVPVEINGAAAAQDDIEVTQNVIIGGLALNNSGGTDKELIRDNIIEGGFAAASPVTVRSNIRGGATGVSGISKVSGVAPVFSDEVDYFLSRIAFEDTADSPLIARSVDYLYTYDSVVYKSDLGPHMAFIALVTTMYRRSFLLPKFSGDALNEDVQNSAKLMKSINGVPDVSNRPSARMDIVSWEAKSVDEKIRADVAYMERNRNTGCELFYDFEPGEISTVTIDGAHSAGTFEVSIIAQDIPVGTILEIDGKNRYVTQRYPRSGQATKLIIDEVLAGGLADAQAVPIMQIQGGGEYVFVPQDNRKNRRTFSRRRDAYKGMTFTFARQSL